MPRQHAGGQADAGRGRTAEAAVQAHAATVQVLAETLETDSAVGLAAGEATRRLASDGPNVLKEERTVTVWHIVGRQFASFLIAILIVAGVVSLLVGETEDAVVILAIVILNAALGTYQEMRAERALEALMHAAAPTAQVSRDGTVCDIPAAELVRGDLVLIRAGDVLPADLRLTEAHSLSVDESSITGESVPVSKYADRVLEERTVAGDRVNCAYMGTHVSYGRGAGIAFATGMRTELGKIAGMVSSHERAETPLQQRLAELGWWLGGAALLLCAIIFVTGLLRGQEWFEMFLVSISLAVAAVPEGLPAVVTIALTLGLQRMLQRHALIRRLAAVETLGAATVVCTDKTGTLTRGAMAVEWLIVAGDRIQLGDSGLEPHGQPVSAGAGGPLQSLLEAMVLCNDAVREKKPDGTPSYAGSPTESALIEAAVRVGLEDRPVLERSYPRIDEVPFDSQRKRMATVHRTPAGRSLVLVKGAPDVVLPLCTGVVGASPVLPLDDAGRDGMLREVEQMASEGYRVLGFAMREDETPPSGTRETESGLTFLGLACLRDLPRPETPDALRQCREAHVRVIMVTGDYGNTALAIARTIGLVQGEGRFWTGAQLEETDQEGLRRALAESDIFVRVSPEHKLRIVEALQAGGEVVGMTGDGSNDAPALKKADIGIAMGIRGTDVSKEAADMVLTDDNFQSIVSAIHEGRVIYSNIRKVVLYLLSCNLGEILAVFAAMVSGLPLLLQPIQILWLNLVTDGLPALALSVEREEPGVMKLPPRDPRQGILTGQALVLMGTQGLIIAGITLGAFVTALTLFPGDLPRAQTTAFVTLTLGELCRAYAFRVERVSVFQQGLLTNRAMVGATAASAALLLAVVYVPGLQPWFGTTGLTPLEWSYVAPLIVLPFIVAELAGAWTRRLL